MVLKPDGIAFAPHPMLVETDRDKYCVTHIIDFYHRQDIDYADYFQAAWRYKHRRGPGQAESVARRHRRRRQSESEISGDDLGDSRRQSRRHRPRGEAAIDVGRNCRPAIGQPNGARKGVVQMRDYVVKLRKKVELRFPNIAAGSHRRLAAVDDVE